MGYYATKNSTYHIFEKRTEVDLVYIVYVLLLHLIYVLVAISILPEFVLL